MRTGPEPLLCGSATQTTGSCAKAVSARKPITEIAVSNLLIQFHLTKSCTKVPKAALRSHYKRPGKILSPLCGRATEPAAIVPLRAGEIKPAIGCATK